MINYSGWGRSNWGSSDTFDLGKSFSQGIRGVLPVGGRRSYGDSSLNSGGYVLESTWSKSIYIDPVSGVATCGAGVTIGELEKAALKSGFFPSVVPGTEFVSLGGAIAADVHGKSHHVNGSFSKDVKSISVKLASGELVGLKPEDQRFWATVGGMGLTGVVTSITLGLQKVETSQVVVENKRVADLESMLVELREMNDRFPHTVAWIDLSGDFRGRGIVSGGRHALVSELSKKAQLNPLQYVDHRSIRLPDIFPNGVINSVVVHAFNEMWFRKPLGSGVMGVQKFMHPLDSVGAWNRIYGKSGFLQYQFVIPLDQIGFIRLVLAEMKNLKIGSFLGVLKSFGEASEGHLSFPFPGWTLAVDIPANVDGLNEVLNRLDEKLVEVGGRLYISKDARMSSEHVKAMYPRIDEWREIREQMDPNHVWQSDQSRRLRLCAMD